MALDDHDRNLEKALARHLRPSLASDSSLGSGVSSASDASSALSCPDAEILAAYHDGSLSAEERNAWKSHVLACDDCQLVLEHLATPVDELVALEEAAASVVVAAPSTSRVASAVTSGAASALATAASIVPVPASVVSIARPRKVYFRWLVPAGAIAAGLLTWVVIHESQPSTLIPKIEGNAVQTAENRSTAAPPPGLSAPSRSSTAEETRRVSPAQPARANPQVSEDLEESQKALPKQKGEEESAPTPGITADTSGDLAKQMRPNQDQLRDRLQSAQQVPRYAAGVNHGPRVAQQQQQSPQISGAIGGIIVNDRKTKKDAELAQQEAAQASKLPAPAPATQQEETSNFIADGSVTPPPPPAKTAQPAANPAPPSSGAAASRAPATAQGAPAEADKVTSSSQAVAVQTETVVVESAAPSTTLVRAASVALRGPQLFSDAAQKSMWRVGPDGSIELSTNNGATWVPQISGVTAELFTGSAPAAKVCWIVGANGTILRTIDAGKHWLKLSAPAVADILGIHASDAFHATVWLVPDPKSTAVQTYKTADGGLTWSLIPNE
jgi:hypothetical protein